MFYITHYELGLPVDTCILFLQSCLVLEPSSRLTCAELLEHQYFDGFREWFEPELQALIAKSQQCQTSLKTRKPKV